MTDDKQYSGTINVVQQKETIEDSAFCPQYHQAIELIGRRWMGAILFALMKGPRRFSELESMIPGISHRLLTERLRELEEQQIVIRRVIASSRVFMPLLARVVSQPTTKPIP